MGATSPVAGQAAYDRRMELLIILVILVLVVVAAVIVFPLLGGLLGGGILLSADRHRRRAVADAPAILDAAFDGRDDVVFKVNLESLPHEMVMAGARERGYRLLHETVDSRSGAAKTLYFERA